MKATINFRTPNEDVVSILVEPVIAKGMHSIRVQRMDSLQKEIKGISRFFLDNEPDTVAAIRWICVFILNRSVFDKAAYDKLIANKVPELIK
jgi:hypothetical protein